jgi:glutaredoxin
MNIKVKGMRYTGASAWAAASVCALWLCLAGGAQAQMVYRIVGADGRVTFSDKPPGSADTAKVAPVAVGAAAAPSTASLPYELRQVVARYPVTLYSGPDCVPCANGRSMLNSRGIPFAERTVSTAEDIAALKRLSGENGLPYLSIGGQRLKGFSDQEWGQYLDAAGYPTKSMLPAGYRQATAIPLVAVEKPAAAQQPAADPAEAAPVRGPTPANPAGIQF